LRIFEWQSQHQFRFLLGKWLVEILKSQIVEEILKSQIVEEILKGKIAAKFTVEKH